MPGVRTLACALVTCALAAGCTSARHGAGAAATHGGTRPAVATPPTSPAPATTSTSSGPTPHQVRAQATAAIGKLASGQPHGAISVAAMNMDTGAHFAAGSRSGMWTASAYKLFVLEALLLQHHGPVDGDEAYDASTAIENSDNAAGYRLFLDAGGNAGMQAAARRFGMKHTVMGDTDPTFTKTSASDFLVLARNLVDPDSPLTPSARKYALRLMSDVEADQRWGVSAAADKDSVVYNKNGWLSIDDSNEPSETDDGRWAVTSIGIIRVHHQRVIMAIFTQHQPLMDDGVRLVERLAKIVAPVVGPDSAGR